MSDISLFNLHGSNRKVCFLSSNGTTINKVRDNHKEYSFGTNNIPSSTPTVVEFTSPSANISLENNKLYLCNCDLGTSRISIKGVSEDFKYAQIKFRSDEGIPASLDGDITFRTAGDSIQEGKRHTITFAKIDNELVAYVETV